MDNMVLQKVWQQGQRLTVDDLSGCAFTGENAAHTFEISGKNASGAVAISGTIAGKFLRSDNVTVPVTGTASDGVASITLTEDCYAVPGRFIFSVYANDGTHNICIYCGVGNVLRTDSGEYEGGEIITDVTALINAIETAVATIPADYSTLLAAIAPTFYASTAYAAGSYVWYDGALYRFTADHAAGSWTGTDAAEVALANDVADLKSAFDSVSEQIESAEVTQSLNSSYVGVTVERVNENTIKIYGTSTAARRILCLNGQNAVATSSTTFSKTLDANTYAVSVSATGYASEQNIFSWQYTYTTFANAVTVVSLAKPTAIIVLSQDAMFGITFSSGVNFGTSDTPTYITINVQRYSANDEVARAESANVVHYTSQTLTSEQETQARENIDCVGNDTLYKFNFFDALELGNGESGTYKGVTYTKNADNSWTVSGTATALSFRNIINSSAEIPRFIIPGRKYKFLFNGGTIPVRLFVYKNGTSIFAETYTQDFEYTFPTDMDGVIVRYQIESGTVINPAVTVKYAFVPETITSVNNQYTYNTTVEQTVQQISNTYDLNVSPSITTDDHGWLMAVDTNTSSETGKTDMTAAIMAMLTETGYCHLSEGIFYVSGNIDMPSGSTLCGCGKATIIRLLQSVSEGYVIKMTSLNTLKDLCVSGGYSAPSTWAQTRTGILFSANQDGQEGSTQFDTDRCLMDDVWVENFTDSGIKCHNTTRNFRRGLYATNIMTASCWCGLNIDYNSEFNKFTHLLTSQCVIGCINNGGNNVFTACTFHGANIGFSVDGTQPNSAHGTINGCTFCHAGSNSGSAITMTGVDNGFVISDCQIWYNTIDLTNCSGIVFSGCEFGRTTSSGVPINISGGNTIMFNGCVFMLDSTYTPSINITNNTKVKFDACYGSESGNEITGN